MEITQGSVQIHYIINKWNKSDAKKMVSLCGTLKRMGLGTQTSNLKAMEDYGKKYGNNDKKRY